MVERMVKIAGLSVAMIGVGLGSVVDSVFAGVFELAGE